MWEKCVCFVKVSVLQKISTCWRQFPKKFLADGRTYGSQRQDLLHTKRNHNTRIDNVLGRYHRTSGTLPVTCSGVWHTSCQLAAGARKTLGNVFGRAEKCTQAFGQNQETKTRSQHPVNGQRSNTLENALEVSSSTWTGDWEHHQCPRTPHSAITNRPCFPSENGSPS